MGYTTSEWSGGVGGGYTTSEWSVWGWGTLHLNGACGDGVHYI